MTVKEALIQHRGRWCVVCTVSGRMICATESAEYWYNSDAPYLYCEALAISCGSEYAPRGRRACEILCDYK